MGLPPFFQSPLQLSDYRFSITFCSKPVTKNTLMLSGHLTYRSTRTLPLRGTVLTVVSGFPVSPHRADFGNAG